MIVFVCVFFTTDFQSNRPSSHQYKPQLPVLPTNTYLFSDYYFPCVEKEILFPFQMEELS